MTTTINERTQYIEDYLRAYFKGEIGVVFSSCRSLEVWDALAHSDDSPDTSAWWMGLYDPLPFDQPGAPPLMISVCPERIANLTDGMDDDDLNRFLDIVCFIGARLIVTYESQPDPVQRYRAAEEMLLAHDPNTMRVLIDARLRAEGFQ